MPAGIMLRQPPWSETEVSASELTFVTNYRSKLLKTRIEQPRLNPYRWKMLQAARFIGKGAFQKRAKTAWRFFLLVFITTIEVWDLSQAFPVLRKALSSEKLKLWFIQRSRDEGCNRHGEALRSSWLPNGTVKETKVIGGYPILVNAAVDAVKKWRFEAARKQALGHWSLSLIPETSRRDKISR
jgi:hypothetical protein